jgi:hypothetical protein
MVMENPAMRPEYLWRLIGWSIDAVWKHLLPSTPSPTFDENQLSKPAISANTGSHTEM